jgi:hypothetical protein
MKIYIFAFSQKLLAKNMENLRNVWRKSWRNFRENQQKLTFLQLHRKNAKLVNKMRIFVFAKAVAKIWVRQDQMRVAVLIFCSCKKKIFSQKQKESGDFFAKMKSVAKRKFREIHEL